MRITVPGRPGSTGDGDLFARHAAQLPADTDLDNIVVLILCGGLSVANRFAAASPGVEVHVLDTRARAPQWQPADDPEVTALSPGVHYAGTPTVEDRVRYLMPRSRPHFMIDAGSPLQRDKLGNLRHLFFLLRPGGCYVIDNLAPSGEPHADAGRRATVAAVAGCVAIGASWAKASRPADPTQDELARSIASASFRRGCVRLVKAHRHLVKLREWEADATLTQRYGDAWGRTVEHRPARSYTSRARVTMHGDGPFPGEAKQFEVPARRLREYYDVVVASNQIVLLADYVLPDTFRHLHQPVLAHRRLRYASPVSGRLSKLDDHQVRPIEGSFYLLDTEHPGHYGHVTTEVLSRVWGWREAVRQDPTVRALVTGTGRPAGIPEFERVLLEAAGVRLDDALVLEARDTVRIERLFAATPQFENPYYVDPEVRATWQRVAACLQLATASGSHRRLFVTRSSTAKRRCHQHHAVERFFRRRGFLVFRPETLPFEQQARLFAGAEVIAGYGGSGMFTMLLTPQARVLLITGNGYNAENEHLIAAVNGNELHYFWGVSDLQTAQGHSQLTAARSDFSFDLRRFRRALDQAVGQAADRPRFLR